MRVSVTYPVMIFADTSVNNTLIIHLNVLSPSHSYESAGLTDLYFDSESCTFNFALDNVLVKK